MTVPARRLLARLLTPTLAVLATTVAMPPQPASALVVPSPMGVIVGNYPHSGTATGLEVCGYGRATSAVNQWELLVAGVRVHDYSAAAREGSGEPEDPINERVTSTDADFDHCMVIPHNPGTVGHLNVTLTYVGRGPDVTMTLLGFGSWAAGDSGGTGTSIGGPPAP